MSVRHEFQAGTTDIASGIVTRHGYGYLVSASVGFGRDIELPVGDGAKSFLPRVIREFLHRWKPDVCHEAAAEMS